jgi:uncharacterized protein (TIGR00730 family)
MTTKAYKNLDFLTSREARTVRMLAEYLEPQTRFQRLGVHRAVIFWGSARIGPEKVCPPTGRAYYESARELAGRLAQWTTSRHKKEDRYFICTGAGPCIMEAANRGAYEVNPALSMGLNISIPFEQSSNEFINPDLNLEFHYFFLRKFWFVNLAQALVIFPGGYGTMDELFELLTLMQTGKKSRIPILLFGKSFWEKVVNFRFLAEEGLISKEDLELFFMTDDLDEAFTYLRGELERHEQIAAEAAATPTEGAGQG